MICKPRPLRLRFLGLLGLAHVLAAELLDYLVAADAGDDHDPRPV